MINGELVNVLSPVQLFLDNRTLKYYCYCFRRLTLLCLTSSFQLHTCVPIGIMASRRTVTHARLQIRPMAWMGTKCTWCLQTMNLTHHHVHKSSAGMLIGCVQRSHTHTLNARTRTHSEIHPRPFGASISHST